MKSGLLFVPLRDALLVLFLILPIAGQAVAAYHQNSADMVVIEAESGSISGGHWQAVSRQDASGGTAMRVTESQWLLENASSLTFSFLISSAGPYHINLRGMTEGVAEASAWILLDGQPLVSAGGGRYFYREGWEWDYGNLPDGMRASLSEGQHTIRILSRGANLLIDKLIISPQRDQFAAASFGPGETDGDASLDSETPDQQTGTGDTDTNTDLSGNNRVLMEAEDGVVVGSVWRHSAVSSASGGAVMMPSETHWGGAVASSLNYRFEIESAGLYYISLRGRSNDANEKSVWVYLNGEPLPSAGGGRFFFKSEWEWDYGNILSSSRANLSAGTHEIRLGFGSREAGLQVDRVLVSASKGTDSLDGSDSDVPTSDPGVGNPGTDDSGTDDNSEPTESPTPPDTNTATNSLGIGLVDYSKDVSILACSSSDAVRISVDAGNIGLLSSSSFRVFCIAPGDYRNAGTIQIQNQSGASGAPRVIRLDSSAFGEDGSIFGEWPARNQALMPPIVFTNSNNWILDRLTFTGLSLHAVALWNSDNIVINRIVVRDSYRGINIKHGSDSNTVQNSFFADMLVNDGTVCIGLNSSDTPGGVRAVALNNQILNNEIRNCVDGIQFVAHSSDAQGRPINFDGSFDSSASLPGDFSGTLIAGNDIYTTPDYYTNCTGSRSNSGDCGMTENALDIKSGALSASNPVKVVNNRFWGFRTNSGSDPLTQGSNDPGSAVVIHFGASKNIELSRNIIWDSTQGISVVRGANNLVIRENIISDLTKRHGRYGDRLSGVGIVLYADSSELSSFGPVRKISLLHNHVVDVPSSVTGVPGRWGAFSNVQSSTAQFNVSINAPAANGVSWMGSSNSFGLSKSEAKFAQLCFSVGKAAVSDGQTVCLDDVLRTTSSPVQQNASSQNYWHAENW